MQHIFPYIQQITKFSFHCSSEELQISLHTTEDRGPRGRSCPTLHPLTPWATKWLMRLACTGRWNLGSSKLWRDDTDSSTAGDRSWVGGWLFFRWHPGIPTSKWFWNNKEHLKYRWHSFLEGGHVKTAYRKSPMIILWDKSMIIWTKISQIQNFTYLFKDDLYTTPSIYRKSRYKSAWFWHLKSEPCLWGSATN